VGRCLCLAQDPNHKGAGVLVKGSPSIVPIKRFYAKARLGNLLFEELLFEDMKGDG
jgi:hypothetical protein